MRHEDFENSTREELQTQRWQAFLGENQPQPPTQSKSDTRPRKGIAHKNPQNSGQAPSFYHGRIVSVLTFLALFVFMTLLVASFLFAPFWGLSSLVSSWASITVAIVFQAMPFLVLGTVLSAAINTFLTTSLLTRFTPRRALFSVPTLASCGLVLPGCECGAVPVSNSLQRRGLPACAAIAFMLASPAINPVVLAATAVAFTGRPYMMWARAGASFLAAVLVGWIWIFVSKSLQEKQEKDAEPTDQSCEPNPSLLRKNLQMWEFCAHLRDDFLSAAGYLAFGAMLAALLKVVVPAAWFNLMGDHLWAQVLIMAILAVVLSLCSEADAFIAASFSGISPVALLVFLVLGPMVDIKLIAMQYGTWGSRFVLRFVPITTFVAIFSAVGVGLLLLPYTM